MRESSFHQRRAVGGTVVVVVLWRIQRWGWLLLSLLFLLLLLEVPSTRGQSTTHTQCRPRIKQNATEAVHLLGLHDTTKYFPSDKLLRQMGETTAHYLQIIHETSQERNASSTTGEWSWWDETTRLVLEDPNYQIIRHAGTNFTAFRALCERYFATNMVFGFMGGGPPLPSHVVRYVDAYFRLGEAFGCRHVYSPEHLGVQWDLQRIDLSKQFSCLQRTIGDSLMPPQFGGMVHGIRVGPHKDIIFMERHQTAVYMAYRIRELLDTNPDLEGRVCEIGGGAGYLAYYALRLGIPQYLIADLTQALLAQYYVLVGDFGPGEVNLMVGDNPIPPFVKRVTLLNALMYPDFNFDTCEIVVNMDSFPEMAASVAQDYFQKIRQSRQVRYFLSQNQESRIALSLTTAGTPSGRQNDVREMALRVGFRSVRRYQAWMRMGYVEELFLNRPYDQHTAAAVGAVAPANAGVRENDPTPPSSSTLLQRNSLNVPVDKPTILCLVLSGLLFAYVYRRFVISKVCHCVSNKLTRDP